MTIVVTGGCGYIGSHVCVKLIEHGYDVLILDDFSNARADVPQRIGMITGCVPHVLRVDVSDARAVRAALADVRVEGAIHLAGLKAVAESVRMPLAYYRANVSGTINVREAIGDATFVFSSSATVYGRPDRCPIDEEAPTAPVNPYGKSKLMAERVLLDAAAAAPGGSTVLLRYFNPVGAHSSGRIGDDPRGIPNNLMPSIERVAVGLEPALFVHGRDYDTRDGTAVRDYVHIEDIAEAHVRALDCERDEPLIVNLGSAAGATVLEVITAFERVTGRALPVRFGPRRDGDIPAMWADAGRARALLGWRAKRTLNDACTDALRWRTYASRELETSSPALHPV